MVTHLSQYVAQDVAAWLEAQVHRLDTHAYWSAVLCQRNDRDRLVRRATFFEDYCCDTGILRDWIKRGVVTAVSFDASEKVLSWSREKVEATLEACLPFISIPLTEAAEARHREYRDPDPSLWYEAVVDAFADEQVSYGLTLWGYKYRLDGLSSSKDSFYIITDNLGARVRFINRWISIEESARELRSCLATSHSLASIKSNLEQALAAPRYASPEGVDAACRDLYPLLERVLRDAVTARGWGRPHQKLDRLITVLESQNVFSHETSQMARLVAKPFRDAVTHGHRLSASVAKVLLVSTMDLLVRIAHDLEGSERAHQGNE